MRHHRLEHVSIAHSRRFHSTWPWSDRRSTDGAGSYKRLPCSSRLRPATIQSEGPFSQPPRGPNDQSRAPKVTWTSRLGNGVGPRPGEDWLPLEIPNLPRRTLTPSFPRDFRTFPHEFFCLTNNARLTYIKVGSKRNRLPAGFRGARHLTSSLPESTGLFHSSHVGRRLSCSRPGVAVIGASR